MKPIHIEDEEQWKKAQNWTTAGEKIVALLKERTDKSTVNSSKFQFLVDIFFRKSLKHYQAIIVLCREGFGQDALILSRTLLELYFKMKYLNQPEGKKERIRRADQFEVALIRSQLKYARNLKELAPSFSPPDGVIEKLEALDGNAEEWEKKCLAIATEIGEAQTYRGLYSAMSFHIHSEPKSYDYYFSNKDKAFCFQPSDMQVHMAIKTSTICFSKIFEIWRNHFKGGGIKNREVDKILKECQLDE